MAAYTEHYHLHQWEPEDNFLRTDFNEDFRVLDKALALKPEILSGSYTGDDARSRDISLGVSPRAVFVVRQDGAMQSDSIPMAAWRCKERRSPCGTETWWRSPAAEYGWPAAT